MKKLKKRVSHPAPARCAGIIMSLMLIAALLAGCGASSSNMAMDSAASTPASNNIKSESSESYLSGSYDTPGYGYDISASAQEAHTGNGSAPTSASDPYAGAKLIYTASLSLQTTEFDASASALAQLVADMGGYFENSSVDNYGSYRYGSYTVRIPAESFESFCTAAGSLCQLNSISRSAEDVSEYYYDTETRLATQRTKLERLQELLSQAESMEDIITLESAISETELAIENLTGTLRRYDSLVGFSTVNISLDEVYRLEPVEEPVIGFWAKLGSAFRSGSSSFVRTLESLALDIAYGWVGWLIFLAAAAVVIVLLVRARRRAKARRTASGTFSPRSRPAEDSASSQRKGTDDGGSDGK